MNTNIDKKMMPIEEAKYWDGEYSNKDLDRIADAADRIWMRQADKATIRLQTKPSNWWKYN